MLDVIPATPAGDSAAPAQQPVVRHTPEFSGRAGEYFGIWFVNLLLGIVTLGIYSAWGKVRTQRYFHGNTRLAGASFDYLASPIAILKGRLIAYAVVIALMVSSHFAPVLYLVLVLAVGLLMPALITWSLRFRARNTAWRGLSFRFDESAAHAYGPFLLWPWLAMLTLSILYPEMKRRQQEFIVEGHRFGHKRFAFKVGTGPYYKVWGAMVLQVVLGYLALIGVAVGVGLAIGGNKEQMAMIVWPVVIGVYALMFVIWVYAKTRYTNLMWNHASLGPHRFESTLRMRDLLWLYLGNGLAIVCTLGLMVPWAMVRLARYRAEHLTLVASGDLGEFLASSDMRSSAAGEEMVDALDVGWDIGL